MSSLVAKHTALSLGLDKIFRDISFSKWAYVQLLEFGDVLPAKYDYETALKLEKELYLQYGHEICNAATNLNHSYYERMTRLNARIKYLLSVGQCFFLTLTFNDKILQNTSKETRRKYVRRFLKSFNTIYVANIDFGSKNGREHYHAVLQAEKINSKLWTNGSINFKKIYKPNSDKRLSKYITKLKNHALKETVQNEYLIYSR